MKHNDQDNMKLSNITTDFIMKKSSFYGFNREDYELLAMYIRDEYSLTNATWIDLKKDIINEVLVSKGNFSVVKFFRSLIRNNQLFKKIESNLIYRISYDSPEGIPLKIIDVKLNQINKFFGEDPVEITVIKPKPKTLLHQKKIKI